MIPSESPVDYKDCKVKRKSSEHRGTYKNAKKFKPSIPTAKELEELREAENLFQSNFFKMQMDELLNEVKPKIDTKKLEEWLSDFEKHLSEIPETSQEKIDEFPVDVKVPVVMEVKSTKGVFRFIPSTKLMKIGSWCFNTVCSASPVLDLAVEIPKACWQQMDHLNERYHRKRALYLACIAQSLQTSDLAKDVKFAYQNGCHLKPNLMVTPTGMEMLTVCLTAYPCKEAFKITRFAPTRNNVRSSWFLETEEDDLEIATPYYNASILMDILLLELHNYLSETIVHENIAKGIVLFKLWGLQRGLITEYGRINGFIASMLFAYLLKKQKVSYLMSPYQVFRAALLFLRGESFIEGCISLADAEKSESSIEKHKKVYSSIFLDPSGLLNILFNVTTESLLMLKHESSLALKILDSESTNSFSLLFMNKISAIQKFDCLLHLHGMKNFRRWSEKLSTEEDKLEFLEDSVSSLLPKLCSILRKGLKDRILLLDVIRKPHKAWLTHESPPHPNRTRIVICFLLNPQLSTLNIEKGPLADDPEAKAFRAFWGDRSEMRRFQDGSIREAVFWPASTLAEKRAVFKNIVKDILIRHVLEKQDLRMTGWEMDSLLQLPPRTLSSDFPAYGTGEETHLTLMQSYDSLTKLLRGLDDLPLQIVSIQGISPALHFCEVFPPLAVSHSVDDTISSLSGLTLLLNPCPQRMPSYVSALRVVLGFESSGKWPDDLEAIKRVKTAFLIKIVKLIRTKHSLIAIPFLDHADILKDGYVFRLELACPKEIFLSKQVKLANGVTKMRETEESRCLELDTQVLPKLSSLLHGLHQQHNSYGPGCRLAKRWISSQLAYGYLQESIVELLVAHCYLHPEPFTIPCSPQVAFIRFLTLLVKHEWKLNPLFVNFNLLLKKSEMEEMCGSFTSDRSSLPAMVIVTPLDKKGTLFTKSGPHPVVLQRIRMLAEASLAKLHSALYGCKTLDLKLLFRPYLESFDTVIFLNRHMLPKLAWAVDHDTDDQLPTLHPFKELNDVYPVVDFDPALCYLEELRSNFDEFAYFFYDVYGGDCIAVVYKKAAFSPREFSSSHVNCRYFAGKSMVGNIEAIVEDFRTLGTGLVKEIKNFKKFDEKLFS